MKNIGVVYHPKNQAAPAMVNQVLSMLGQMGAATWQSSAWDSETISQKAVTSDFIITVGGDGTILRTATHLAWQNPHHRHKSGPAGLFD